MFAYTWLVLVLCSILVLSWGYLQAPAATVRNPLRYMLPERNEVSHGVELLQDYLNTKKSVLKKIVLMNDKLRKEMESANFWTGASFLIDDAVVKGIVEKGLNIDVIISKTRGKSELRQVFVPFHADVRNEKDLKDVAIEMLHMIDRSNETASLVSLPFGDDYHLPLDFRWNEVPHATWVRNYA